MRCASPAKTIRTTKTRRHEEKKEGTEKTENALHCIALALDVLYHPAPSARLMGDTARMRTRPYLVGITLVLFAVSLLVCGTLLHFMPEILYIQSRTLAPATALLMSWIDLAIITLIAATVFLIGQAIVSYEIFTGNALLRRGLRRRWYSAVTLAAGFSGLLAVLVVFKLPIVYGAYHLRGSGGVSSVPGEFTRVTLVGKLRPQSS